MTINYFMQSYTDIDSHFEIANNCDIITTYLSRAICYCIDVGPSNRIIVVNFPNKKIYC